MSPQNLKNNTKLRKERTNPKTRQDTFGVDCTFAPLKVRVELAP
jgi:hypothetical protein